MRPRSWLESVPALWRPLSSRGEHPNLAVPRVVASRDDVFTGRGPTSPRHAHAETLPPIDTDAAFYSELLIKRAVPDNAICKGPFAARSLFYAQTSRPSLYLIPLWSSASFRKLRIFLLSLYARAAHLAFGRQTIVVSGDQRQGEQRQHIRKAKKLRRSSFSSCKALLHLLPQNR